MAGPAQRRDAFGAYYFSVQIKGLEEAFFRSCSGLKSDTDVVSIQEGGVNSYEHKQIGLTKFPNVVLKQGFAGPQLCQLRESWAGTDRPPRRFDGTITQLGPGNKPVHKWMFHKGWICKWEGPEFDAGKNEISVESIEIAHHGLKYVK